MIEIKIIATGSKGNCIWILEGSKSIIIDPGIRFDRIQRETNFKVHTCDLCLISHEHKDHSLSASHVSRCGVPLVMSRGTSEILGLHAAIAVSEKPILDFEGWDILPFQVQHDANEPLGFLIRTPLGEKILYATDTYYIKYCFPGVAYFLVEANYQKELLDINETLHPVHKDRVRRSHFEIENLKEFFRNQDLSQTKKIYLIHLSDDNSDEEYFKSEIEKVTGKPVYFR